MPPVGEDETGHEDDSDGWADESDEDSADELPAFLLPDDEDGAAPGGRAEESDGESDDELPALEPAYPADVPGGRVVDSHEDPDDELPALEPVHPRGRGT